MSRSLRFRWLDRCPPWSLGVLLCACVSVSRAAAQAAAPSPATAKKPSEHSASDTKEEEEEEEAAVAPDSPRASLADYLQLARRGRYAEAAAYLDLKPEQHD